MGRRDAVQFTLEVAAECRRLGARVTYEPGWETRGNGTTANYEGCIVHHTAFLSSASNVLPAKNTLIKGRASPPLPGPLCNSAGPYCDEGDPWVHIIAAHPANHAGASGGRSMGPLPVASLFNPRVWGHEIDYGGLVPMTKGQLKAALIVSRAVCNVLRRGTDWVRAHAETSVTGKWDPGYAPGRTIDMDEFRTLAAQLGGTLTTPEDEDDMQIIVHPRGGDHPDQGVLIIPPGHKKLKISCDHGWQALRLIVDYGGNPDGSRNFTGWPGRDPFGAPVPVRPGVVSVMDLPPGATMVSVQHMGPSEKGQSPRPVTIATAAA